MNNLVNSILIKDASGQMKTVKLSDDQKKSVEAEEDKIKKPEEPKETFKKIEPSKLEPNFFASNVSDDEASGEIKAKTANVSSVLDNTQEIKKERVDKNLDVPASKFVPDTNDDEVEEKIHALAPEETMPAFYFDLEQEKEVSQFRNRERAVKKNKKQYSLNNKVEILVRKIVDELGLEKDLVGRLKKAIELFARGVRNKLGTQEVLTKQVDRGGVGLKLEQAERILKMLKQENFDVENIDQEKIEEKMTEARQAAQNFKEETQPPSQVIGSNEENQDKKEPVAEVREQQIKKESVSIPKTPQIPTTQEVIPPTKIKINHPQSSNFSQVTQASRVMTEIKQSEKNKVENKEVVAPAMTGGMAQGADLRRVSGPVEELANLDLENFRRLGGNIQQVLAKIKEKINLMQEESYERRAEGVRAWQNSGVYREYLKLGEESMDQGKSIKEIIKDKQNKNQPTLSYEEFEAIADFNSDLFY